MRERLESHEVKYEERRKVEEGRKRRREYIAALACQGLGVELRVDVNVVAATARDGLREGSMRGTRCCRLDGSSEVECGGRGIVAWRSVVCGRQMIPRITEPLRIVI
jgi:hypothetical protein